MVEIWFVNQSSNSCFRITTSTVVGLAFSNQLSISSSRVRNWSWAARFASWARQPHSAMRASSWEKCVSVYCTIKARVLKITSSPCPFITALSNSLYRRNHSLCCSSISGRPSPIFLHSIRLAFQHLSYLITMNCLKEWKVFTRLFRINYPVICQSQPCCPTSKFPFDDAPSKSPDYLTRFSHSFDAFVFEKRSICHIVLEDVVDPPIDKIR